EDQLPPAGVVTGPVDAIRVPLAEAHGTEGVLAVHQNGVEIDEAGRSSQVRSGLRVASVLVDRGVLALDEAEALAGLAVVADFAHHGGGLAGVGLDRLEAGEAGNVDRHVGVEDRPEARQDRRGADVGRAGGHRHERPRRVARQFVDHTVEHTGGDRAIDEAIRRHIQCVPLRGVVLADVALHLVEAAAGRLAQHIHQLVGGAVRVVEVDLLVHDVELTVLGHGRGHIGEGRRVGIAALHVAGRAGELGERRGGRRLLLDAPPLDRRCALLLVDHPSLRAHEVRAMLLGASQKGLLEDDIDRLLQLNVGRGDSLCHDLWSFGVIAPTSYLMCWSFQAWNSPSVILPRSGALPSGARVDAPRTAAVTASRSSVAPLSGILPYFFAKVRPRPSTTFANPFGFARRSRQAFDRRGSRRACASIQASTKSSSKCSGSRSPRTLLIVLSMSCRKMNCCTSAMAPSAIAAGGDFSVLPGSAFGSGLAVVDALGLPWSSKAASRVSRSSSVRAPASVAPGCAGAGVVSTTGCVVVVSLMGSPVERFQGHPPDGGMAFCRKSSQARCWFARPLLWTQRCTWSAPGVALFALNSAGSGAGTDRSN